MIEGNLKDVSLPGLLQVLGTEVSKNFRVRITSGGQTGEIYVCKGIVVAAAFGLLEGEDAISEFLSWREGTFWAESLTAQVELKKNLKRAFQPSMAFVDHSVYLASENVGLNAVIAGSASFGTVAWQESLRQQPLEREDFVVLGWVGEGRTMRQALREFGFDIVQATAILARLLMSNSIQVIRPSSREAVFEVRPGAAESDPASQRWVETGGQEQAAANVAQEAARAFAQEATAQVAQDAFISSSYKPPPAPTPAKESKQINPIKKIGIDLAAVRASMEARLRSRTNRRSDAPIEPATTQAPAPQLVQGVRGDNWAPQVSSADGASASAPTANHVPPSPGHTSDHQPVPHPAAIPPTSWLSSSPGVSANQPASQNADLVSNPSIHGNQLDEDSVLDNGPLPSQEVRSATARADGGTGLGALLTGRVNFADPVDEGSEEPLNLVQSPRSEWPGSSAHDQYTAAAAERPGPGEARLERVPKVSRTEALPLVTIDIERLLQATFSPTQFGKLALTNPALDQYRRQTLLDVEAGKSLALVISEGTRPAAAVLSSYRYCMDRGYIEPLDAVIPLTADLLLGRMEIDQYLLQRRRITGDELRDLVEVARKEAVKLTHVLVRSGYLTPGDLDTLDREQKRFAFK